MKWQHRGRKYVITGTAIVDYSKVKTAPSNVEKKEGETIKGL